MAESLFQQAKQAIQNIKETFTHSSEGKNHNNSLSERQDLGTNNHDSTNMNLMQSILSAGLGNKNEGEQKQENSFQQSLSQKGGNNLGATGNVISSIMANVSDEDKQQIQKFEQSLGMKGEHTAPPNASTELSNEQAGIAEEVIHSAAQDASPAEKAQLEGLAEELDSKI